MPLKAGGTVVGDWKDAGLQPAIHFGGAQLPEVPLHRRDPGEGYAAQRQHNIGHVDVRTLHGDDLIAFCEAHTKAAAAEPPIGKATWEPVPGGGERRVWPEHSAPPAGERTPEARLINVSRMALAARIKHGVPLADMLSHFQTLALVEANLMSYSE